MSRPDLACVLTTIQPPTPSVFVLARALAAVRAPLLVVGDRKGPAHFDLAGDVTFLPLAQQLRLPFRLAATLPVGHYSRKNLGYLLAIQRGVSRIYETDDDNQPNTHWRPRSLTARAQPVAPRRWMNVYRAFSDELIWPRAFPLERITDPATYEHDFATPSEAVEAPVQQGLADGAPDVDAVWRLVQDRAVTFSQGPSLWLPPGTWCPFNSQTTWWWPEAYPLLYLPSHCSFRMTDVWRSFVAQRCLWELGRGVVFHAPEVSQQRNPHDLLRDFSDEIPGYLRNDQLAACLEGVALLPAPGNVAENLRRCYRALTAADFFPAAERMLVEDWVEDVAGVLGASRAA